MRPVIMLQAWCECGWSSGRSVRAGVDEAVRYHRSVCELWVKP